VDLREFFRIERRWHGVLWIIRILRSTAVPDRASAQRFSLVHREQTNGLLFLALISVVFCGFYALPLLWAACLGTLAVLVSGIYSIRVLFTLISWTRFRVPCGDCSSESALFLRVPRESPNVETYSYRKASFGRPRSRNNVKPALGTSNYLYMLAIEVKGERNEGTGDWGAG